MPRKAPSQVTEMRMTMGTYERNLVTEIKTDIEKSIKIAAVGAVAVPVTLGVGLVGGMGLLGYGLYQGLSSFGFGNITKEIGEELRDAKNNAWCWWTNKNRKFWGLEPIDCTKNDPDIPPSRRDKERTEQEQLDYELYRQERKRRTDEREAAKKAEMGGEAYQDMIDNFDPSQHSSQGQSQSDEEKAMREARRAEAAERQRAEEEEADAANRAAREERRRQRQAAADAQEDDGDGDYDPSNRGGGSSAGGGDTSDNSGNREGDGNAPSRRDDANQRGGRS